MTGAPAARHCHSASSMRQWQSAPGAHLDGSGPDCGFKPEEPGASCPGPPASCGPDPRRSRPTLPARAGVPSQPRGAGLVCALGALLAGRAVDACKPSLCRA